MNQPDSNQLEEEIENEHKKVLINGIWKSLDKKDLLEGTKVITTTWACEKKTMVHTMVD